MSRGRKPIYHVLGVGIVIGVVLGLELSGTLDPLLAPSVSAPAGKPRTSTDPYSGSDPNVVMVDAEQAQRLMIVPEIAAQSPFWRQWLKPS